MATTTRSPAAGRPLTVTVLAAIQFLVSAAGVVIILGEGTADGELSTGDVALAVGAALAGAAVIGSTTGGGRWSWWGQLVLAPATAIHGAITMVQDKNPGGVAVVLGTVWLLLLLLSPTRNWFLRPQPA